MKRETSINNVRKIANRLKSFCGLIGTPECDYEALRISRAWVFGSTVKGSLLPNDTDILLEVKDVGEHRWISWYGRKHWRDNDGRKYTAKMDKSYYRRHGMRCSLSSRDEALKLLAKDMKKVRLHLYHQDNQVGDIDRTKIMIYPRMDFTCE